MKGKESREPNPERIGHIRPIQQLIDEFADATRGALYAFIIVAFEKETKFVDQTERKLLKKLNSLIRQGGNPIGFFGLTRKGKVFDCFIHVFREFAGQTGIDEYVKTLGKDIVAQIAASLGCEIGEIQVNRPSLN